MTQWHCRIGNRRYGPLTAQELKRLAASGELHRTDLVQREGDTAWSKASAVRGLFAPAEQPAGEHPAAESVASPSRSNAPAAPPTAPIAAASAPAGEQAAAMPGSTLGRRKLTPRDMLGVAALSFSGVLIAAAIWFAFSGRSSSPSFDGGASLAASGVKPSSPAATHAAAPAAAQTSAEAPTTVAASAPAVFPAEPRVPQSEAPALDAAPGPPAPAPLGSPPAADSANAPAPEVGAVVPTPATDATSSPIAGEMSAADAAAAPVPIPATGFEPAPSPAPASSLPAGENLAAPVQPVQPADFQDSAPTGAGPDAEKPMPAKPAADLPVGAVPPAEPPTVPESTADPEAPAPPDPRDDAYRQKLEQLFAETKKTLGEAAAAQNEVAKVNNEIQQAQAAINAAAVQMPQLTLQLTDIANRLSGPAMPLAERQQLKLQGKTLEGQLMMLVQAKQNSERQLGITLQRKLKEAESHAADAAKQTDAVLPNWIELSDPSGEQSRVAHTKMADSCTQWLAGDPEFIPAFLMRGFARWHAGQADAALQDFDQVVARADGRTKTKNEQALLAAGLSGRSVLYAERKQEAEAKADFGKAAELCPKSLLVCVFRGRANAALGKTRSAVDDFLKATKMDSKAAVPFRELAWLLATSPTLTEGKRAAEFGRTANELSGGSQWQCLDAYAVASAAEGSFDTAIDLGRKALEAAPHDARPAIEQRLKLYQAGVVPTNVRQR